MDFDSAIAHGVEELNEFFRDWVQRQRDYANEAGDNWE